MCRFFWAMVAGGWLLVVGIGGWKMLSYELTPAAPGTPILHWPAASHLVRDAARPTLLLFAHPHCPCSRATLAELDRLVSPRRDRVAVRIVMIRPTSLDPGWERTDLWPAAERIAGASVLADPDGTEAQRFGARTSGEVMLFNPAGQLVYDGGITGSRGHEGDNAGRAAVAALIDSGGAGFRQTPVFGCALLDHCSSESE